MPISQGTRSHAPHTDEQSERGSPLESAGPTATVDVPSSANALNTPSTGDVLEAERERLEREIRKMEAAEAADVLAATRRRHAELKEAGQGVTITDPAPYFGKGQRKYTLFVDACADVFDLRPLTYAGDAMWVRYARQFLRGSASDTIRSIKAAHGGSTDYLSWDNFTWLLQDLLTPAHLRRKIDMVSLPEEHLVPHFFHALSPAVRTAIRARETFPATRRLMVEVATTIEHTLPKTGDERTLGTRSDRAPRRQPVHVKAGEDKSDQSTQTPGSTRDGTTATPAPRRSKGSRTRCEHCGKYGHTAEQCYRRLKEEHSATAQPQPKEGTR
ncbi:MAG: hypothetical protein M1826_007444 [Phylliscum demangeonii]|nr:MAG: hypothetical protein M1826_007444 [Phylliscum demangeonii]